MRRFITFGPALVVLLAAVVTLLAAPATMRRVTLANAEATMQLARQNLEGDNILKQIDRAVRSVAEAVEPSVVHIGIGRAMGGRVMRVGQGSGWVFDNRGHVVTNAHVVRDARQITVQFYDGRAMDATLIGQDPTTDIAVLKVNTSEGLFPVTRASGVELHQGERVFAFGSPFGFKFSMSEGIVSATGRDPENLLGRAGGYTNFIQTDAAVNPGNSGGPLVNVEGKLVGMNVAIATAANAGGTGEGQNSGISFAIPLETIERVVEQIIETGGVSKGFLGISLPTTDDDNERALSRFDVKGRGVIVLATEPSGPAGEAGMKAGDVITKINGRAIPNIAVLRSTVSNMTPGQTANVEVIREGESIMLRVVVGERTLPTLVELQEARKALTRWGVDELVQTNSGNLLIASMIRGSEAMRVGLRPGMIISRVEGEPVRTIDEFDLATARPLAQGRRITVTVSDDQGQERDVEINPRP